MYLSVFWLNSHACQLRWLQSMCTCCDGDKVALFFFQFSLRPVLRWVFLLACVINCKMYIATATMLQDMLTVCQDCQHTARRVYIAYLMSACLSSMFSDFLDNYPGGNISYLVQLMWLSELYLGKWNAGLSTF